MDNIERQDQLDKQDSKDPSLEGPSTSVEMPADEEAAMKFTRLLPYVRRLGDALPSKGGLVRVLHAMAEFPLGAAKPRLLNDSERQLFQVMMELNGYKSTVITAIMKKQTELEKVQQEQPKSDV